MYEEIYKKLQDLNNSLKKLCEELKEKDKEPELTIEEKKKEKRRWGILSTVIIILNVSICLVALCQFSNKYKDVLEHGEIKVVIDSTLNISLRRPLPKYIYLRNDSIIARKSIGQEEQLILYSIVDESDARYPQYKHTVDELIYLSNNDSIVNWRNLLLLTFYMVLMGCIARTFYDYIGRKCYKRQQDMRIWWPWYLFRLLIGAPIATFIIVASRCAMFSTLFSSGDLNTYLVISFLAGFSMMEFLSLLRAVSKGLFEKNLQ